MHSTNYIILQVSGAINVVVFCIQIELKISAFEESKISMFRDSSDCFLDSEIHSDEWYLYYTVLTEYFNHLQYSDPFQIQRTVDSMHSMLQVSRGMNILFATFVLSIKIYIYICVYMLK